MMNVCYCPVDERFMLQFWRIELLVVNVQRVEFTEYLVGEKKMKIKYILDEDFVNKLILCLGIAAGHESAKRNEYLSVRIRALAYELIEKGEIS